MEAPKGRSGSFDMAQKTSAKTPEFAQQQHKVITKTDCVTKSTWGSKSPRNPAAKKKRPSKPIEPEMQLSQELKKLKKQLSVAKSEKLKLKKSECEARSLANETSLQLEEAAKTIRSLESEMLTVKKDRSFLGEQLCVWMHHGYQLEHEIILLKNELAHAKGEVLESFSENSVGRNGTEKQGENPGNTVDMVSQPMK